MSSIEELEQALAKRGEVNGPYVIVIDTGPYPSTEHGGTWWNVGIPEVSERAAVNSAHAGYVEHKKTQRFD